jgi:DNA-binding beta-propeller fold protein YncE
MLCLRRLPLLAVIVLVLTSLHSVIANAHTIPREVIPINTFRESIQQERVIVPVDGFTSTGNYKPMTIAVDPTRNSVYFTQQESTNTTLTVMEFQRDSRSRTEVVAIDSANGQPITRSYTAIAVNTITRKLYVHYYAGGIGRIVIIDIAQKRIMNTLEIGTPVTVGFSVNETTNTIYSLRSGFPDIYVLNGESDTFAEPIILSSNPIISGASGIPLVDEQENKLYIRTSGSTTMCCYTTVIDAASKQIEGNHLIGNLLAMNSVRLLSATVVE